MTRQNPDFEVQPEKLCHSNTQGARAGRGVQLRTNVKLVTQWRDHKLSSVMLHTSLHIPLRFQKDAHGIFRNWMLGFHFHDSFEYL